MQAEICINKNYNIMFWGKKKTDILVQWFILTICVYILLSTWIHCVGIFIAFIVDIPK